MDKFLGKLLDERYEIKSILGYGGMAVVYNAYDVIEKKYVAIKILKEEFLENEDFIKRFNNESKTIAVLSHPNIVKIYDVSFGDKIQYIVMENIDGITLKEYIDQQKKVPWKEAVHFTIQILKALSHAHNKGIIHRDIKPQNIMLLRDGTIKVTDFGIAKFSDQETRTMTDRAIGSVHYISPEQAKGEITDEKSDLYSVGIILYEMLTGKLPFTADNAVSVAIMQLQTAPKPLRQIDSEIPEGLEEITLKAMQKNPKYRYDSAEDMLFSIDEFRKNPSIKFEYKYFVDQDPTRYVDAIDNIKATKKKINYDDDFIGINKKKSSKYSKSLSVIIGVVITLVVFFGVLVSGILTNWFGLGAKDVDVPMFIGQKLSEIVENKAYKFEWNIEYSYNASKPEGIILDQEPKPYSKKVKEDAKVTLFVNSSGSKIVVPVVKGKTEEVAKSTISSVGLNCEVVYVEETETSPGIVISADPQEGQEVTVNSTVKIFVSKGSGDKKVMVPNVIGKTLIEATNILTQKGLTVSSNIVRENSTAPKDEVLATDPQPGLEIKDDQTVTLTISSGEQKEKTVSIYVDLPGYISKEVYMKVYVDGVLDSKYSKTIIPAYNPTYTLAISGKSGIKSVVVNLDGKQYRSYEINFDKETVKTLTSFAYPTENKSFSSQISSGIKPSSYIKNNLNSNSYNTTPSKTVTKRTKNVR